jgi:hypothetical protein
MTDIEFDRLLTRALWLAAEEDYDLDGLPEDVIAVPAKSKRKIRAMLRNPIAYVRRRRRPIYIRALRTAAVILLALSVAFGAVMAVPSARAAIIDFVRTWFGDRAEYTTLGAPDTTLGEWKIGYIPEGFEPVAKGNDGLIAFAEYSDNNSMRLSVDIYNHSGTLTLDNEHSDFRQTEINGQPADIYESNDAEYFNHIVIYAADENVIIKLSSELEISELIKIAASIVLQ